MTGHIHYVFLTLLITIIALLLNLFMDELIISSGSLSEFHKAVPSVKNAYEIALHNEDTSQTLCNRLDKYSQFSQLKRLDHTDSPRQLVIPHQPSSNKTLIDSSIERGVWIYPKMFRSDLPLSIIDEFKKLGINTIYFGGTTANDWNNPLKFEKYLEFTCYAYSNQVKIYPVTLEDPFFAFEDPHTLSEEFSRFVSQTKGLFDTYIVDVEPHTQHLSDAAVYLPKYIRMSIDLKKIAENNGVTHIDTVPYWYHHVIKNIGISQGLDVLGGAAVNIMDYSYSSNRTIENLQEILKDLNKPYTISVKITPGYGDPYLSEKELIKTKQYFQNHSIPYGLFESQYLLRNYPAIFVQ